VETIRLIDYADANSMVTNQSFVDALILGPVVVAPISDVAFGGTWEGNPDAIFIEIPDGRYVFGIIGLSNVTFDRCVFRNVGIAGTPETIAKLRKGFMRPK